MAVVSPLTAGEWLVVGDEGEQVGELQRQLQHLGYYEGEFDERYGDVTESAVREFQQVFSRTDDGRVDHETWESLDREAQFAGYDPYSVPDAVIPDQSVEARQLSDDGEWWWDGTEWQAVDEQAHDQTMAGQAEEPRQLSADGRWEWDGVDWTAVDHDTGDQRAAGPAAEREQDRPADIAWSETTSQTPAVDPTSFPDVREGDAGEWVTYLHSMLTSAGF